MRTIQENAPPAPEAGAGRYREKKGLCEAAFGIELITPMYGGGTVAGVNDPEFPIRPSSVRGQLRFWWRATRGAKFESAAELFKEEEKIWGSTEKPGGTVVRVIVPEWKQSRDYIGPKDNNYGFQRFGPEGYVLFPASADTSRHNLVKEGLVFKAVISFEGAFEADILCAVWAWTNFGGIGGRTRRGCGALFCKELSPEKAVHNSVVGWWKHKMDDYGLQLDAERAWPTLFQILTGSTQADSLKAWQKSIDPMKNFRQGVGTGRSKGSRDPKRPGRSFWPEPDTLRRAFGRYNSEHKPDSAMPDGFPRAAFGLPIIFHFVASREDPESELYPNESMRMSSPLILRPLKAQDGEKAVPAVVYLHGTTLDEKKLKLKNNEKDFGAGYVVNPDFTKYRNSPMQKYSKSGSAVEAFLAYAKEQGFREVCP